MIRRGSVRQQTALLLVDAEPKLRGENSPVPIRLAQDLKLLPDRVQEVPSTSPATVLLPDQPGKPREPEGMGGYFKAYFRKGQVDKKTGTSMQ
jgi:hypothetical protein